MNTALTLYAAIKFAGAVLITDAAVTRRARIARYHVAEIRPGHYIIGGRPVGYRIVDAALKLTSTK